MLHTHIVSIKKRANKHKCHIDRPRAKMPSQLFSFAFTSQKNLNKKHIEIVINR